MPEGHSIRIYADRQNQLLAGKTISASSPQKRFTDAKKIDGLTLRQVEGVGKHLFYHFAPAPAGRTPTRGKQSKAKPAADQPGRGTPDETDGSHPPPGPHPPHRPHRPHRPPGPRVGNDADDDPDDSADDDTGDNTGDDEKNESRRLAAENGTIIHVHLGRLGGYRYHEHTATGGPPPATPACRMRLTTPRLTVDLSGPTTCQAVSPAQRQAVLDRLGPDPLRPGTRPTAAWERIRNSTKPIGALLLDQSVIAGLGNIFRAEILFRLRIDPRVKGSDLTKKQFDAIWKDSVAMLRAGVKYGWIITTRPRDIGKPLAKATQNDRFYVYKRKTCRVCAGPIRTLTLGGRTIYYCPTDQKPA